MAESDLPIKLVHISSIGDLPAAPVVTSQFLSNLTPPPTDMLGPGDVLNISIYEAGVTLFAGSSGASVASAQASAFSADTGVRVQNLPPSRINDDGDIFIPYAGKLHVIGHTLSEVETMIRQSLRGLSQRPEVTVTLQEAITNSIIISGEVTRPGRLVLKTNRETLSDAIALAGGYRGNAHDLALRVQRHAKSSVIRLDDLIADPSRDVRAYPGDRLMLINEPRAYSVLGAGGKVEQLPFSQASINLAQAIANAGGVNYNIGDPKAVFVFRYVHNSESEDTPTVYHINMMKAGSYFLAQRFTMQDGDVLYFGNAEANQPSKLFQIISQLFTPLMTVTAAVQTVQNTGN
ncbi:polysaccharide biosynthesis/export family protein [Novosphingobium sp. PY1]|uniref:polysaccharide biosynthesis/export family protein n=1 Tax=Novosphingobium sp. PY1 TaxID=1882221 RepID=UPI002803E713|nr:polysaccharide biosynthesis/export family protein [Novosphingobium sp. PY1]